MAKTKMRITDVQQADETGDLVVAVKATRGNKSWNFPYHIKKANIGSVTVEYLQARVMEDVDAMVEQESKEGQIVRKLQAWQGKEIALD